MLIYFYTSILIFIMKIIVILIFLSSILAFERPLMNSPDWDGEIDSIDWSEKIESCKQKAKEIK